METDNEDSLQKLIMKIHYETDNEDSLQKLIMKFTIETEMKIHYRN